MTYKYRVTLSGIKGFFRVYKVNANNTLYSFHKQMRADMEFPADQLILFKELDGAGEVLGRVGLFDLGFGAADQVTLGKTVKDGVASFVYFYDVTNKKSVNITFEGEIPDEAAAPELIETKGPDPIDFENAEGNFGMADAVLTFLSMKLPISRLQRDLTDSTVIRNIGVPMAHGLIAFASLKKGLGKLILNETALHRDLEANWAVVAEAIQTILRRENYPNPYETLKALTRTGKPIDEATIKEFIRTLDVSDAIKAELDQINPWSYTGY